MVVEVNVMVLTAVVLICVHKGNNIIFPIFHTYSSVIKLTLPCFKAEDNGRGYAEVNVVVSTIVVFICVRKCNIIFSLSLYTSVSQN